MEQPDHKASGRIAHALRTASTNHSRPMSADDIQKAKMRAMFMQHKYGKTDPSSSGSQTQKIEDTMEFSLATNIISTQKTSQDVLVKQAESSIPSISSTSPPNEPETSTSHTNSTTLEDCLGILRCKLIQWKIPQGIWVTYLLFSRSFLITNADVVELVKPIGTQIKLYN